MNLNDNDYEFLAKCKNDEFINWCVRWLKNNKPITRKYYESVK